MSLETIKPADDYPSLRKQFSALKSLALSLQAQLHHLQAERQTELVASKLLDSEREANAILTAEIELLKAHSRA